MIKEYYSGWEALNLAKESGAIADWHPLSYWGSKPQKYIFNKDLGDWGISERFISFIGKKDYVANYPRAIADLVLKNDIKGLKNCIYDYLDDDEAKELYEILKKYKTLDNIKNFLKYELTKYYFLDKENKDFRAMLDYGGQSHLGNYPLKIEVSNRNKIFLQQGALTYTNIDGVNVYNISELIDMKIAAFNGRDKVMDLYDLNFLLNKYPEYFDCKQLWQINERIAYCGADELNMLLADEVKMHKLISNENIDLNNFVQNFQARIQDILNDKRIEKQKEFIKNLSVKEKNNESK